MSELDALDRKAADFFPGKVVRKDLARQVKVGANAPIYVLEYLLGKYCATDDPAAVAAGLRLVNATLSESVIRPDEAMKAHSRVKERGAQSFIDKVSVRLEGRKYWATAANFGNANLHVTDDLVRRYERLLEGGLWAHIDVEYREEEADDSAATRARPFYITDIRPIQVARFDLDEYRAARAELSTGEWLDLLIRSIGMEPEEMSRRVKLLTLLRLAPMVQKNYNLVELGPRGTGKSFVYRDLTPYAILVSGGKTTVANLFYNMSTMRVGLVGLWDVVAFDEVAGIRFGDKSAVQILKDYMESGSFSRGREEVAAEASLVFAGNINQPVDVLVRVGTLFQPLPEEMQDMALIDRFHYYLPGWEMPKMHNRLLTDHYGFIVDYLAEALRELRRYNYTELIDEHFALGSHLNTRDDKAVRRTVSAYVKLLHPAGDPTPEELREYLELAMEGRRRVKEQLKKMGAFEYYHTSFSYMERADGRERFVGVPEEGGQHLIGADPLPPGSAYAASLGAEETVCLSRIELSRVAGSGRLRLPAGLDRPLRDSLTTAFDYLRANKGRLGIEPAIDGYDYMAQVINLTQGGTAGAVGVAFLVAFYSLAREMSPLSGLVVLGEMTLQGNILPLASLMEPLQVIMDNGGKRVLIPTTNKRQFLEVPSDVLERVDPIFYSEPAAAALKGLGVG